MTKIKIKSDGVRLKTTNLGLALQVLTMINETKAVGSLLDRCLKGLQDKMEEEKEEEKEVELPKFKVRKFRKDKNLPRTGSGHLKTWTEEEDDLLIELIKNGFKNKEIAMFPKLLKNHTSSAVNTRVSGIRYFDKNRCSIGTIRKAKEILKY